MNISKRRADGFRAAYSVLRWQRTVLGWINSARLSLNRILPGGGIFFSNGIYIFIYCFAGWMGRSTTLRMIRYDNTNIINNIINWTNMYKCFHRSNSFYRQNYLLCKYIFIIILFKKKVFLLMEYHDIRWKYIVKIEERIIVERGRI